MLIALIVIAWIVLAVFALRDARWAYAVFIILAFVWIPARTGFHFHRPNCNLQLTIDLALFAASKYKHIFLFGMFYLMTRVQLGRMRYAMPIAFAATIAVGMLIELEETLTRTGNCNLRDLVPDVIGAVIGEVVWRIWQGRGTARPTDAAGTLPE